MIGKAAWRADGGEGALEREIAAAADAELRGTVQGNRQAGRISLDIPDGAIDLLEAQGWRGPQRRQRELSISTVLS